VGTKRTALKGAGGDRLVADRPGLPACATCRIEPAAASRGYHPGMLGTLFRIVVLRILGGRAAAVLAIVAVILGWRGRRAERRIDQGTNGRAGTGGESWGRAKPPERHAASAGGDADPSTMRPPNADQSAG
jgi:hypothetical protein